MPRALLALLVFYGKILLPDRALAERDIPGLHLPMLTVLARVGAEAIAAEARHGAKLGRRGAVRKDGPFHGAKLVLRVVPGIDVPAEPPACGALRSQPCREFQPLRG